MKNSFIKIFALLILLSMLLCSCDEEIPPQESTSPAARETVGLITDENTETTEAATAEATAAYTDPAATSEPEPNPYNLFTYERNKVNVSVSAPYAMLIDAKTNEILYFTGDPFARIYPASTTKLLTAIVALKYCDPAVEFIPGDELTLLPKGSSIAYVKTHHRLSLEMLIEGMMLPSGGDAAYAVAAGVGRKIAKNEELGGIEAVAVFIEEMNRYGREVMGLTGSHFTCPDGNHDDDHYTTLLDIMTIARYAMDEPIIMKYAAVHEDNVRYASGHKNTWTNSNSLIDPESPYFYENATGLKTGTTDEAGKCLISTAALGTKSVLAGVFAAKTDAIRYEDSKTLLTAGMAH